MSKAFEKPEEFSIFSLLKLIKFNRRFIALFILVFLVVVIGYSFIQPHKYEAYATLLPPEEKGGSSGLGSFIQSVSGGGGLVLGAMGKGNKSQVFKDILQSRTVAKYIADKLDLYNDPRFASPSKEMIYDHIRALITIEVDNSGLVTVAATSSTPYFPGRKDMDSAAVISAKIANTAIEGLDFVLREKNVSSSRKTREYIEGELIGYRKKLDSMERELEVFQSANKVLGLEDQISALVNQAITIGTELNKAIIDLTLAEQEYSYDSPKVKAYKQAVEKLKTQYEKVQSGGLIDNDEFSIPLKNVPELLREYTNLVRDIEIIEKVIIYLETQRHQEAIQEERDIPVVEALDKAYTPQFRAAPNRKLMLVLGFFIATFLALLIIVVRAYIKGMIFVKKE